MKIGDLVNVTWPLKPFTHKNDYGVIVDIHKNSDQTFLVFWNNDLHWKRNINLEVIKCL